MPSKITKPAKVALLIPLAIIVFICASGAPFPKSLSLINTANSQSTIDWQSCTLPAYDTWFADYAENIDTLQCATIEVTLAAMPLSANESGAAPDTATTNAVNINTVPVKKPPTVIKLALSRLPATGNKLGTLISIAGGPGQSGLDVSAVDSKAYKKLSKHFDVIGFAPRGVYPTTPNVICDPDNRVLYPEDSEAFAKGCWQYTPNDLLAQLGADYAVGDIEAIRQALGELQINLIGYSYGTKIAALYAEKFPDRLRAGVLDGVVNLNEDDMRMQLNQEASVQQTFERFVDQCRLEPDCFFADTTTLAEAEAKIAKIYSYFDSHDVRDLDGQRITPTHISWTLYGFMVWPDRWPILNEALHLLAARDFSLLQLMIDEDKGNVDYATFTAIDCADRAPTPAQKQRYLADAKLVEAQSTWDNHREPTRQELLDACYYWPVVGSDVMHAPVLNVQAPTLLLVAQTNDPATPYANAVAMQKYLNAALLTRNGDGHTLALSDLSRCVDNKVVEYLIDPESIKKYKDGAHGNKIDLVCED